MPKIFLIFAIITHIASAAPMAEIKHCTLVPTDWADGDSFQVDIPATAGHKSRRITVRLYGADCIETHINDDNTSRRLRAQRRYFGITTYQNDPQKSIALAKGIGQEATQTTRELLKKPFTVYTTFADARGDANFKRYYAFVITHDGQDLAATLVSRGLARAHGVYHSTPDGHSQNDYRADLQDLELQAAKAELGAWKFTDWATLTKQRLEQRAEDRELELAHDSKSTLTTDSKIHINKASRDELMRLPGVGEVLANRIIENRPYRSPNDLLKVNGIGKKSLQKIAPYLLFPAP